MLGGANMKSLVIMGMVILMGISSLSLDDVKNIEDSNLSTIESVDADETDIDETEDAGFDNVAVESKTYEEPKEQQTTTVNDEDVLECKEVIAEEFFESVVSIKSTLGWKQVSKQNEIDRLKNALWTFKLKKGKPYEELICGGVMFFVKYEDGTEKEITISGQKLRVNDVWYDIVNNNEIYEHFNEELNILYSGDDYGEGVFDCQELLSKEFFEEVEEVSFSYGDNTLTKEKEIEKFKKNMWLFKVRKSEKTDSGKSDSLVFDIKSKDGSKKQVIIIINDGTMIIDGDCYDIVNYNEVLSEFMEALEKLSTSED